MKLLDENSLAENENSKQESEIVTRYILFNLHEGTYGINVSQVQEVLNITNIRKVSCITENIIGIINLNGVIVTIIDLHSFLGINSTNYNKSSRIIILELNDKSLVGVVVDSIIDVKKILNKNIETVKTLHDKQKFYIKEATQLNNKFIIIIDINAILKSFK